MSNIYIKREWYNGSPYTHHQYDYKHMAFFFSFVIPISPHISILSQIILNKSWILFLLQIFQYGIAKL